MTTKKQDDSASKTTDAPVDAATDPIDAMVYEDVKAEIAVTANRLSRLQARKAVLEESYARGDHWKDAAKTPLTSDEGISYASLSSHRIVNLTDQTDKLNAHRLELHVAGRIYTHVEETSDGQWIYRNDK